MELFLQPNDVFEKTAGTRMPEDPNAWPQEILQQLFKEVPYMSDFSPHVTMDKVDAEKGYAFGYVTVMNQSETQLTNSPEAMQAAGIRQVRIPVVIKDGEMFPLDLIVTDDASIMPLTEDRLRTAIFRPQAFDVTAKTPGDQSMIGQLYPPYRQNYGLGGGGGGAAMGIGVEKEGSVLERFLKKEALKLTVKENGELSLDTEEDKKQQQLGQVAPVEEAAAMQPEMQELPKMAGSILKAIAPTINVSDLEQFKSTLMDPDIRLAYEKNAAANIGSVQILLENDRPQFTRPKLASIMHMMLRPDVIQLVKLEEGYLLKQASHNCWAPFSKELTRAEALEKLGARVVLAADLSGSTTMSEGADTTEPPPPDSDMQGIGPASEFGQYKVYSLEGEEIVGYVIPNLIDVDGSRVPVSLFTNGSQSAVQSDVLGVAEQGTGDVQLPTGDRPDGYGSFFAMEGDQVVATIPVNLSGSFDPAPGQPAVFQGETYDGRPVEVSLQPNIQTVIGMDGRMLVPAHWQWLPLGQSEAVDLLSSEDETPKEAAAKRAMASVEVVSGGQTFSIRGIPAEKLASDQREFLDIDGALFLLAGFGVDSTYGIKKLAQSLTGREPVQVKIGRYIKLAEEQAKLASARATETLSKMPALRHYLFKEAAFITDPEAVDTVLSLGFINPENVTTFIGYMPMIEKSQEGLCNLLFAARLGLADIPVSALETAVRSTEEVLEGLKTMAFQGPALYS